jgi:putative transposase
MSLRHRTQLGDNCLFFVTTSTKNHRPYFLDRIHKVMLLNTISETAKRLHAQIYAYVLMPSHFHLLIGISNGRQLSVFMHDVKSLAWRRLYPQERGIWQERFDDVSIVSEEQFRIKLAYTHNNPVKARLCRQTDEYEFSSARAWLTGKPDGITCLEPPI